MESFFSKEKSTPQKLEKGPYQKQLANYLSTLEADKTEAICKHLLEVLKLSAK